MKRADDFVVADNPIRKRPLAVRAPGLAREYIATSAMENSDGHRARLEHPSFSQRD
jgi:hypothetical protein